MRSSRSRTPLKPGDRASYTWLLPEYVSGPVGDMTAVGGRLVMQTGESLDPTQPRLLGRTPSGPQAVSPDGSRAYAASYDAGGQRIHCYHLSTFTQTGSLLLPGFERLSAIRDIALWGRSGLAVLVGYAVAFLPDVLANVPGCSPNAGPAPAPSASVGPDAVASDGSVLRFDFEYPRVLERNPIDGTVYLSVGASDARFPNQVVAIAPGATRTTWAAHVGSSPEVMAVAGDGSVLYVGLRDAAAIAPLDLRTRTAGPSFSLGLSSIGESIRPIDLDVAPGDPATVVAAGNPINNWYGSGTTAPLLFNNGTRTYPATPRVDEIVLGGGMETVRVEFAGPQTLYAYGSPALAKVGVTAGALELLAYDAEIVADMHETPYQGLFFNGGRLFAGDGSVLNPAGPTLLTRIPTSGAFAVTDDGAKLLTVTSHLEPIFTVDCFETATSRKTGSFTLAIPGTYAASWPAARQLVLWGSAGVALLAGDRVLLLAPNARATTSGCL